MKDFSFSYQLRLRPGLRLCLILLFLLALAVSSTAQAARGTPGSPEFGMGAVLYPQGPRVQEALSMAADLGLDWISVPLAWDAFQPDPSVSPNFETLDPVMQFAAQKQIAVMVSLTASPAWARAGRGPDPEAAARLVITLAQRYPKALQAVELFPGANTRAGWGSRPDPKAYAALFAKVDEQVRAASLPVRLVAAGLQPLETPAPAGDMDDLQFLQGLYRQGAARIMPVISLHYGELSGDPLSNPQGGDRPVFRHYEEVRRIMVTNNHQNGLIWITHLSLPSGKIGLPDSEYQDLNAQSSWMSQIYIQTRSQLYVGLSIGQSLNPESEETAEKGPDLLLQGAGGYHPFYSVLREMISLNKAGGATIKPGQPKEGNFIKGKP